MTGLHFLRACLEQGDLPAFRSVPDTLFTTEEQKLYKYVAKFLDKNGHLPMVKTASKKHRLPRIEESLTYYSNRLRDRKAYTEINDRYGALGQCLKERDPEAAMAVIQDMLAGSKTAITSNSFTSMEVAARQVMEDYKIAKTIAGLRGITSGFPSMDEATMGAQPEDLIVIAGRNGTGKAQPLTSVVWTPSGKKLMGEIKVGDKVCSVDGEESIVQGVYPQGLKKVYEVSFVGGSSTRCCAEHLWLVGFPEWSGQKVIRTDQLQKLNQRYHYHGNLTIPLTKPVEFTEVKHNIHPYCIGVLLAENPRKEDEHKLRGSSAQVIDVATQLRDLGICSKDSTLKTIPDSYMRDSIANRLWLLRGLFDCDGEVSEHGWLSFSTASEKLCDQVSELLDLMGAVNHRRKHTKGGQDIHKLVINHDNLAQFFTVSSKVSRADYKEHTRPFSRVVSSITLVEAEECQCIAVSHPSKLYLTDHCIVTHNTYKLLKMAMAARNAGYSSCIVSMEMGVLQIGYRWMGMELGINPRNLRKGQISSFAEKRFAKMITNRYGRDVPTNFLGGKMAKTVDDVHEMVEKFSPQILFVDAAYLLKQSKSVKAGISKWEQIGGVVGDLKTLACEYRIPVVITVQFNRNQKDTGSKRPDTSDIGGSDSIPQDASVLLGIQRGQKPFEDSVRRATGMKNREGELFEYDYDYQFDPPKFDERPFLLGQDTDETNVDVSWMG